MDSSIFILLTLISPIAGGIVALFVPGNIARRWIGLTAGFASWGCAAILLSSTLNDGPQTYRLGNWIPPYGIVLVSDILSALFVFMASSVLLSGYIYIISCKDESLKHPAFMTLFMSMQTGLLGAFLTGDVFTLFVFMELMVISSVAMVAISDNPLGLEAAVKYIFISSMGSMFLLIGISTIYATYGTLNLANLSQLIMLDDTVLLERAAAIMLMLAFLLKSAVFPFHFWQPDFHTTAPTPLSAMLSSVVVKVGIYGMIRLTTLVFIPNADLLRGWLIGLGLVSIFFGSLSALRTHNGKRMLAYSTFGQIGFILLGIGWGTPLALAAAIIYTFNHAFIKSAMLMLMGVIASHTKTKTARLSDLHGVGRLLPSLLGVLYFLGAMALAGLPPMNGFISKYVLVRGGIDAESWWALGLAVAAGALTLLYMVRTWQDIFQQAPTVETAETKGYGDSFLAPALLIAACLLLGVYARPLFDIADRAALELTDPNIYINAVDLFDNEDIEVSEW